MSTPDAAPDPLPTWVELQQLAAKVEVTVEQLSILSVRLQEAVEKHRPDLTPES